VTFAFQRLRIHFHTEDPIEFAPYRAGNVLRGALRFEMPAPRKQGPSGFADASRPFVFRAAHLAGEISGDFHFDVHVFHDRAVAKIEDTFRQLTSLAGVPVVFRHSETSPVTVDLSPPAKPVRRLLVRFLTPTELKPSNHPEFGVLMGRARDRISALSTLYGAGQLEMDFKGFGERAQSVAMKRYALKRIKVSRTSTRTGQTHSIGGFTGQAEYVGELSEFVPILLAAQFTGVGRHTAWGNGEIEVRM